jgi:hypothetical protein
MASYVPRYLRVYLLDDHDLVRRGLVDLLTPATDINVVGDSGSARDAVRATASLWITRDALARGAAGARS